MVMVMVFGLAGLTIAIAGLLSGLLRLTMVNRTVPPGATGRGQRLAARSRTGRHVAKGIRRAFGDQLLDAEVPRARGPEATAAALQPML